MRDSGLVEVFKREEPKLREIQELRERAMTEAKRGSQPTEGDRQPDL
jgi:hypothetical protein